MGWWRQALPGPAGTLTGDQFWRRARKLPQIPTPITITPSRIPSEDSPVIVTGAELIRMKPARRSPTPVNVAPAPIARTRSPLE
jgi:hypothetical protein